MDADEIARRIRAAAGGARALSPLPSDIQGASDVARLETLQDVWNVDLAPTGRWLGRAARPLKELVRRLLAPTLARQIEFNATVVRLARHTAAQLDALAERQDELRALIAEHADQLGMRPSPRLPAP